MQSEESSGEQPVLISVAGAPAALRDALSTLISDGRLALTLRWKPRPAEAAAPPPTPSRHARRLPVTKARGVIRYVDVEQIDWIEAANQYVRLHHDGGASLMRDSMSNVESLLHPNFFHRIHRSVIVRLERVAELWTESPTLRWAVLDDGTRLPVSRSRWDAVQTALLGLS